MQIIILGLRRAGTTAFWRTWRQDGRFVCYDEPFSQFNRLVNDPSWRDLPYTGLEKRRLWERDPKAFWDHFVEIGRLDEWRRGMSDHQQAYLAWLLKSEENVCLDLTRCHFKVSEISQLAPEATLIHLRRPPQNWITSIALPSSEKLRRLQRRSARARRKLVLSTRNALSKHKFWTAQRGFHFQGYEEMMGTGPRSLFGYRVQELGLDPVAVSEMPMVGRLMALWKVFGEEVERAGPQHYGDRFLSVNFNSFCRSPERTIGEVYERLGVGMPSFDFSRIQAPPTPFDHLSPTWDRYFEQLEVDKNWLVEERQN